MVIALSYRLWFCDAPIAVFWVSGAGRWGDSHGTGSWFERMKQNPVVGGRQKP